MPDRTSPDYTRTPRRQFSAKGIDLNTPVDVQKESGTFPTLYNVISYQDGTLEVRPALSDRYVSYAPWGGRTPVHSARRLNDPSLGRWAMLYGVGDGLGIERSTAVGTLVLVETGYDGNPLSISVYRPANSASPYAYIANASVQHKIDVASATTKQIGIQRPNYKPTVFPVTGAFNPIDLFEVNTGWATATAGAAVGATAARVNTTVTGFTYEPVGTGAGICIIQPVAMTNIGAGTVLTLQNGFAPEDVFVTQINRAGPATTIKQILYDDLNVAYAILSAPSREAQTNSLVYNTTRNQFARIRAVVLGPDDTVSLEFKPPNPTWIATDVIQLVASFVCHPALAPTIPGGLTSNYVPLTTAATGSSKFDKTANVDLSILTAFGVTTGATLADYIHISLAVDLPDKVTEIKVYLDIDAAVNDFTRNYYVYSISPSDFTPVTKSTQSALDNRQTQITRRLLDGRPFDRIPIGDSSGQGNVEDPRGGLISDPNNPPTEPPRDQLTPGDNQYSEVSFPISVMTKVGADQTRGPKDVKARRIEIITTAVVVVKADAWVMHGGYPLDILDPDPGLLYAFRFRDSTTGAVSDLSPASRGEVFSRRQVVYVGCAGSGAPTEVDKIDVFRQGGALADWSYVGTVPKGAPDFYDTFSEVSVRASEGTLEATTGFDPTIPDLQPWPVLDTPKSGTATVVAGTLVTTSTPISLSLAPGIPVIINGAPTTLYRVIDTGKFEIEHNLNGLTNVTWEMPQPVLLGQRLPIWSNEDFHGHALACGDSKNPGSIYYTKPKNFDCTALSNRLEICSGSEVVQNIFVWADRAGAFTSRRLFYLEYDPNSSTGVFASHESPGVKGLLSRWAMAVGRRGVAWLADDGIYMFGSMTRTENMITTALKPLFPFAGRPPTDTNGISAPFIPNPVGAEERFLRLCFAGDDDSLLFFYRDASGNHKCIRYDFNVEGWFPHVYGLQDGAGAGTKLAQAVFAYTEEGQGVSKSTIVGTANSAGGRVMTVGGAADNGTDAGTGFDCIVQTYADDFDDPRPEKQVGDIEVDLDPSGATITVTPYFNNFATAGTPKVIVGARPDPPTIIDVASGGTFARNVGLKITWTNAAGQRPRLYHWQPSFIPHPENSLLRSTAWRFAPEGGLMLARGFWVVADTSGANRSLTIDYIDHSGLAQTLVITNVNHPSESRIFYPLPSPSTQVYMSTWRFRPTDANKWRFYSAELFGDPAPPYSTDPSSWTDDGEIGNKFLQGCELDIDTHGNSISLRVEGDLGALLATLTNVVANGRTQVAFPRETAGAFNPAVYTHLMRIVPLGNAHLFGVKWFWQSDAELASYFETQDVTFDALSDRYSSFVPRSFGHMREVWVAYRGAANIITPTIIADGVVLAGIPTFPASAGYAKNRILIPAKKWKSVKMKLSSPTPFYCYKRDCEFWMKGWASNGDYAAVQPFGFISRDRGVAPI